MPAKGGKKAKREGNTSDRSENISEDDVVGQEEDAPPIRHDLTPTMPVFTQGERSPPAVSDNFGTAFTTPGASRAEGNIPPDFRLDNELSLPEQLALSIHEQRFEDAKRFKAAMITEQDLYNLEQQLALAVKDERFDDCIRFCEAIAIAKAKDGQGPTKTPYRLHPQSKMESRSPTTFEPAVEISDDMLRAAQLAHAYDNPPIRPLPIKQERYSDITPDIQDVLIARWFQETQLHDRETARAYLTDRHVSAYPNGPH